jgi:hypothetical protein
MPSLALVILEERGTAGKRSLVMARPLAATLHRVR